MASYSTRWSKGNKEPITKLELEVTDLEDGMEYKFRVLAENAAGPGPACEPITVVAKDPFGKLWSRNLLFFNSADLSVS